MGFVWLSPEFTDYMEYITETSLCPHCGHIWCEVKALWPLFEYNQGILTKPEQHLIMSGPGSNFSSLKSFGNQPVQILVQTLQKM